jgi:short-subunit dehydrogenase
MPVTEDGGRPAKDRAPRRRRGRISWLPQPRPGSAALVTGASSGLGAELARSLAARGHDLVLVARRRDRLDALARGLRGQGVRVHAVDCDLTEPGAGEFLAAAVAERVLEISVLCNNAGAAIAGEFTTYRVERQVAVLRLNLEATVDLCGRFVPSMVRRGSGAVLNVGSLFSYAPAPRLATYAASKAAVYFFTEALHTELRPYGVAVTALCPGTMPTEFMTPEEVMAEAEPVIRAVLPDANVPTSIRSSGVPVVHGSVSDLGSILDAWLAAHADGTPASSAIPPSGDVPRPVAEPGAVEGARVRPGRPRRPGGVRHGHRRSGRPLRRDDQGDPATRHPQELLTSAQTSSSASPARLEDLASMDQRQPRQLVRGSWVRSPRGRPAAPFSMTPGR